MDGGSTGTELIEIVKGGHTPGPPQNSSVAHSLYTQYGISSHPVAVFTLDRITMISKSE